MRATRISYIVTVIILAVAAFSANAATVGVQWVQTDACGNSTINNTKPDAQGFGAWMQWFGHTRKFQLGNANVWPNDTVDQTVSGGMDQWYADDVNMYYVATHGSSNSQRFLITMGSTKVIDGINTCRSWTRNPNTNAQWWRLGDRNARIVNLAVCQGLQLEHIPNWDPISRGIHMITGYHGNMKDSPSIGGTYAFYGNLPGVTVKQAWFAARPSGDRAVVLAYGTSLNDALNRRDNQRFSWSMARLGHRTHRAWSWIQ
jgi:hypothetical protein